MKLRHLESCKNGTFATGKLNALLHDLNWLKYLVTCAAAELSLTTCEVVFSMPKCIRELHLRNHHCLVAL